jgi:hypothetical protein
MTTVTGAPYLWPAKWRLAAARPFVSSPDASFLRRRHETAEPSTPRSCASGVSIPDYLQIRDDRGPALSVTSRVVGVEPGAKRRA